PLPADIESALRAINGRPGVLGDLLDRQHYRLAYWRTARDDLNYRRFFDIYTQVGVCVEGDDVFRATHARVIDWLKSGDVQGVRVDHPDGLRDPKQYLQRLRSAKSDAYIAVEKILERDESLPSDWPVQGTTGYEAANLIGGLFVDPDNEAAIT